MQNIHPLFVHFPIALFVSSLLFGLLALFYKKPVREGWSRGSELENVAKWIWWLGTLFAIIAVGTGWQASNSVAHSDASHEIMELHETLSWILLVCAILFSLWKLKAKPEWEEKARTFTLLFQVVFVSILSYSAHLGGKLVYEFGTGTSFSIPATDEKKEAVPQEHDHKAHSHKHHDHSHNDSQAKKQDSQPTTKNYFCPMKCEGEKIYSKPGRCPVCNMKLTLTKSGN